MPTEIEKTAVANLQRYLRTLYYFDESLSPLPVDGLYDRATEEAVRRFQKAEGLPPTGRVEQNTWERLFERYEAQKAFRRAPARIAHFPRVPPDYRVKIGEEQFLVRVIQHALQEIALDFTFPAAVPQSGKYDEDTANAVRVLQRVSGLPEDGEVDRATWEELARYYNHLFADYFPQ
jgi:peptidoglycan hydrolase-like protein with peptidoglycan-binding domain